MITQNIFLLLSSGNLVIFLINECNSLMVQGNLPEIKNDGFFNFFFFIYFNYVTCSTKTIEISLNFQ
jgi:hypothetical protein